MKKQRIPIFLSSDNNYAPFIATTIASICDNTKCFIDFYVLDCGINIENQKKIKILNEKFKNFSLTFIEVELEKYFPNFQVEPNISKATYARLLIPYLNPNIIRALYSDVDVIVLGDISEMYNKDLAGHILGAVWDETVPYHSSVERQINLNLSESHKYFCAGNLIIDCKKWREENINEKLFKLEKIYKGKLKWHDQDLLNKYFENNYKQLSPKYCFVDSSYNLYKNSEIIIRHFTGDIKPWQINPNIKMQVIKDSVVFWEYAKLTEFYNELIQNCKIKNVSDLLSLLRNKKYLKSKKNLEGSLNV